MYALPPLDTTDADEARSAVGGLFCPHELTPLQGSTVATRLRSTRIGAIGLTYLDYGVPVIIDPGQLETFYLVQIPLTGRARISHGGESIVSTPQLASVLSPDDTLFMEWGTRNPQTILYVDRNALQAQLSRLLGRPVVAPLRFSLGMQMDLKEGQAFWNSIQFTRAELADQSPLLASETGAEQIEQLLMSRLLLAQTHNYSDMLRKPDPVLSRTIRSACDLINDHIAEPLTVTDIAEAVGVSVRSLQDGFRRELDTSPTQYLRERRLGKARELLRTSSPATTSVTDIASSLGVLHLGRFSVEYRRCFGESPSQTLHQA